MKTSGLGVAVRRRLKDLPLVDESTRSKRRANLRRVLNSPERMAIRGIARIYVWHGGQNVALLRGDIFLRCSAVRC